MKPKPVTKKLFAYFSTLELNIQIYVEDEQVMKWVENEIKEFGKFGWDARVKRFWLNVSPLFNQVEIVDYLNSYNEGE